MGKVRLSLSVSDAHAKDLGKIAKAVQKIGMKVEQQLAGLGVITGEIEADKLSALGRIPGVAHVEEERQVGIAPPGSPIQ
jgi:hypothetical protein